jgi:hypothetical protein
MKEELEMGMNFEDFSPPVYALWFTCSQNILE